MDEVRSIETGNDKVNTPSVPFLVHEAALARMERQVKRLFILCIIIFAALVGTNGAWLIYESQFEDSTTVTQDIDTGDGDAVVTGIGDIYGEGAANSN